MSVPGTLVLEGLSALGIQSLRPNHADYAIVSSSGSQPVVTPDTVLGFEYRGEERISTAPIERGSFTSYNKVEMPYDIRMLVVCAGRNYYQNLTQRLDNYLNSLLGTGFGQPMSREDFLDACTKMKKSTDLYDIVTPDTTYVDANLVHFDYRKENRNGNVMLIVDLWFQEVRETASANYTNASSPVVDPSNPSAANQISVGTITGVIPTKSQMSILSSAGFL